MILCRRCTTRFDDDSLERCTKCGADLTGPDGLRLGTALRPDWKPTAVERPTEEIVPPAEPPAPDPIRVEPVRTEPIAERPPSSEPATRPARRRGRRPGEQRDEEVEPTAPGTDDLDTPDTLDVAVQDDAAPSRDPAVEPVGEPPARAPETAPSDPTTPVPEPAAASTAVRVAAATGVTIGEGEVACPACRRANDEGRRFCRYCAATLPAFGREPDDELEAPEREPLIRRLLGTTKRPGRDSRTFAQRAKDSGQRRLKYRAKYTLKSKLRALGYLGGGAAGLMIMLGPVRARVMEYVNPPDPVAVDVVAEEGTPAVDGEILGPHNANDRDPKTAFALPWTGEPVSFAVRLPEGRPARQLEFETGFPNDVDDGSLYRRPATIVLSADGEEQTIELDDHEGPQRVDLDLPGDPSVITMTITGVHERDWTTYERVAIAEVAIVR